MCRAEKALANAFTSPAWGTRQKRRARKEKKKGQEKGQRKEIGLGYA
jgi:hypothetical protein